MSADTYTLGNCLGRLLAIHERITGHRRDQQDANLYTLLSTDPVSQFGPMMARIQTAMAALREAGRGDIAEHYDTRIAEIIEHMEATPLPDRLSLEEQGQFAAGYYVEALERELADQAEEE